MPHIIFFIYLLIAARALFSKKGANAGPLKQKNRLARNSHVIAYPEADGVCLFLETRIDVRTWTTEKWIKSFFSYMKNVIVKSILRQCKGLNSCTSVKSFDLFIKLWGHHTQLTKFIEDVRQIVSTRVFLFSGRKHKISKAIGEIVDENNCKWLSTIYLDADDGLLDGYFDYVTSEITNKLLHTNTVHGTNWRGAVFASRYIPRLVLGNNRCAVYTETLHVFCSGHSQGQGYVLRRDVWESMGRPWRDRGSHWLFLQGFRNFVMNRLGFMEYRSETCEHGKFKLYWDQTQENIAFEKADEARSGIMYIDIPPVLGTSAVFVQTPFSSHFPWDTWRDLPVCDSDQKLVVQQQYPQDVMYLLELADSFNLTAEEVCKNNRYFAAKAAVCKNINTSN